MDCVDTCDLMLVIKLSGMAVYSWLAGCVQSAYSQLNSTYQKV